MKKKKSHTKLTHSTGTLPQEGGQPTVHVYALMQFRFFSLSLFYSREALFHERNTETATANPQMKTDERKEKEGTRIRAGPTAPYPTTPARPHFPAFLLAAASISTPGPSRPSEAALFLFPVRAREDQRTSLAPTATVGWSVGPERPELLRKSAHTRSSYSNKCRFLPALVKQITLESDLS